MSATKVNKSAVIREVAAANPGLGLSKIAALVAERGIIVSPAHVAQATRSQSGESSKAVSKVVKVAKPPKVIKPIKAKKAVAAKRSKVKLPENATLAERLNASFEVLDRAEKREAKKRARQEAKVNAVAGKHSVSVIAAAGVFISKSGGVAEAKKILDELVKLT